VNEILSNAFKHAFRGKKHGNLSVSATQTDDHVNIIIRDDGVGIPKDVDVSRSTSLGLKLIRNLVLQLNGSVTITSDRGTEVTVNFPLHSGGK
jgi:two-component sensor histidine kinase